METTSTKKLLCVDGMSCVGCASIIEDALLKVDGVTQVKAVYASATVDVIYDENVVSLKKIITTLDELGYKVKKREEDRQIVNQEAVESKSSVRFIVVAGIVLLAAYLIIDHTVGFDFIPQVTQDMGYGILFTVGLLTSVHCIAMCGGINLSQCVAKGQSEGAPSHQSKFTRLLPSLMYNGGRVISYTVIGGIVGAIGSVVRFSGEAKGVVAIVAGVFMIIMGLNMLDIFPWMRKITPRMPKAFSQKMRSKGAHKGAFLVGLLNGFMPCGPLQTMQLYALGTGSFLLGATSMLFFSLGTVPLMFGFGAISAIISGKFTHKMMKVSALLVVVLGFVMASRGFNLSGINLALAAPHKDNIAVITENVQYVETTLQSGNYSPIVVQKGVPVKWTIRATEDSLNGCNNPMTIPQFEIEKKLVPGDNIIEFTPIEEGTIVYTCWMGMISSTIQVVADVSSVTGSDALQGDDASPLAGDASAGGCCAAGQKATAFFGGNIPTEDILVAKVENNQQEVTITVNDYGYFPAAIVIQKGVLVKIKFNVEKLNSCNNIVQFPEYQGQLDLQNQVETPWLTPQQDFTFQCWMGMLHGYVKVVDDIQNIDIEAIKKDIEAYDPPQSQSGCCG